MDIRFFAGAAEAAGLEQLQIDSTGLTLETLKAHLGDMNPSLARVLEVSSWLADGQRITEGPLDGVTHLDVLPPFAGG